MVVLFFTRQADVIAVVQERLRRCGHVVDTCTDRERFFAAVAKSAQSAPVLAVDYGAFDHHAFNVFGSLREAGTPLPVVFYNHPYPEREGLAEFWLNQNRTHLPELFQNGADGPAGFSELCRQMQEIVTSPDILPCVSLLSPPRPLDISAASPDRDFNVHQFQARHGIGPVKIRLFERLYESRNSPVSAEALCRHIWNSYSEQQVRTLYAYIHDLRQCCRADHLYDMDIVRRGKLQYELVFIPPPSAEVHDLRAREAFERQRHLFEGRKCV